MNKIWDVPQHPGGEFGTFTDRDQRSILLGFEFGESVFLGILVSDAVLIK